MMCTLLIGGDFVPTEENKCLFDKAAVEELIGNEISDLLSAADYRIFNCESPLTTLGNPIDKAGPNLKSDPHSADVFKKLGIDFMTLANNHILDYGETGLKETIRYLNERRIAYSGVGRNKSEAAKPYIVKLHGMSVGIFCCAEHEFSIATADRAGANHFDPLYSLDYIRALREKSDYVLVLYHGGRELYQYPTPRQQESCRRMVECGANLVVCQHSHCVGCMEEYSGGTIVYGQGNFLFDCKGDKPLTRDGLLLRVDLSSGQAKIQSIPLHVDNGKVRLATGKDNERILSGYYDRSQKVQKVEFVKAEFDNLCHSVSTRSLVYLHGGARFEKGLNRFFHGKIIRWCYGKKELLRILNFLNCESHREIIARILDLECYEK